MKENEKEIVFQYQIKASDYYEGDPTMPDNTAWGVVKQIMALDRSNPDFEEKLKGKIKRLIHHQKQGVYEKTKWWLDLFKNVPNRMEATLDAKIETHKAWAKKNDKDIWTSG